MFENWVTRPLVFVRDTTGAEPAALHLSDIDTPQVLRFLHHLQTQRRNGARSRNARLAAVRSFFRFVTMREPSSLALASRVIAIPVKRVDRPLVGYLARSEVDALLASTNRATWAGRRDHALLLTLYNTVDDALANRRPCLRAGQREVDATLVDKHEVFRAPGSHSAAKQPPRTDHVRPLALRRVERFFSS